MGPPGIPVALVRRKNEVDIKFLEAYKDCVKDLQASVLLKKYLSKEAEKQGVEYK